MWDTVETSTVHLSHDLLCPRCGHGIHTFLSCGDGCECRPVVMPGSRARGLSQLRPHGSSRTLIARRSSMAR